MPDKASTCQRLRDGLPHQMALSIRRPKQQTAPTKSSPGVGDQWNQASVERV
ncbi:hypothetical protein [Singulisphaera acidiphila]|uniref:Uncharacterized protein n=1 Tax=Singulisphaera acidiphila (strain ATCC BAA-1392 / DSM 18658 / VKM B-2454 / MOB10) TaxID=886293 RepID=L0DBV7_SINAD|nr:hypothetical protein [Singulisphaera acidiphila]AGA26340.1 hypothetical protein Sinac_1987 [Singulisphaera acidiphila DSM 18658]